MTHGRRDIAESFGARAERYDRARPRYPQQLVDAVLAGRPSPAAVVDVGIGTGISALPFRAAGADVTGVEADPRMAELARTRGFAVDVARFEDWDAGGASYDVVTCGQAWHWIDPRLGAIRAARVLRPRGRLALFWNLTDPGREVAAAFAEVYRAVPTGLPFNPWERPLTDSYDLMVAAAEDGIRAAGGFGAPARLRLEEPGCVSRRQWLDFVPTTGGHGDLPTDRLDRLLDGLGRVIDERGGSLATKRVTLALIADLAPLGVVTREVVDGAPA